MVRRFVVLVFALFLFTGYATSQKTTSHDAAALELLELLGMEQIIRDSTAMMLDAMVQGNPSMAPYRETMIDWAEDYVGYDAIKVDLVQIYQEAFTEAELRDVIAFYQTTTGQKVLTKLPELMQKSAELGRSRVMAHLGDLERMIVERSKQLGNSPQ